MPGAGDFRACYVHARKPAIRNCLACGRPICGECGEFSGDPLRCASCVQAVQRAGEEEAEVTPVAPGRRGGSLPAGEVTVFDDGTVVTPEPPPPGERAGPPAEHGQGPGIPEDEDRPGEGKPAPPAGKAPPREPLKKRPRPGPAGAGPRAFRKEREGDGGKLRAPFPTREDDPAAARKRIQPDEKKPPERRERSPSETSGSKAKAGKPGREKPTKKPKERTGPLSQVTYALPYAVGTAVLMAVAWLLLAKLSGQWTQISIFTMGIAVPWVLFNATTMKKRMGKKAWTSPPPTWMISTLSFAIVSLLTPAVQFLAYKVMYGSNPARLPYSDFAMRYFEWSDWLLVSCGLLLALLLPLMLRAGADWSVRRVRSKAPEVEGAQDGDAGETGPAADSSGTAPEAPEEGAEAEAGPGEEGAGEL